MSRRAVAAALGALLAAVAAPAQARLRLEVGAGPLEFGRPFELVVERAWPRDHTPQPFDDATLAPLAVRLLDAAVHPAGAELVERRRYEAVPRRAGELALGPFTVATRDAAGGRHEATFAVDPLRVRSTLPERPGEIEWAGDVRELPTGAGWGLLVAGLGALALLATLAVRFRPRAAPPPPAPAPSPSPADVARAALAALALPADDDAARLAYYVALAAIARRFAGARFGVRTTGRTSEELVAAAPRAAAPLRDCLLACDLVKFAAHRPDAAAHERARQRALDLVAGAEAGP